MKLPPFMPQKIMFRVLYSLVPVALAAIYFFGWRVLALLAVSSLFAYGAEAVMASRRNGRVSAACFVTAVLYGLSLPPTTPFWIAAVGVVVGIVFGKEVFGGFGKNVFNPAVVGRAFVYVCFPVELTSRFVPVFGGLPGGFAKWSFLTAGQAPEYLTDAGLKVADALTSATPMWSRRTFGFTTDLLDLALGTIGGVFEHAGHLKALAAGSAGEVSGVVIILSGIYLLFTKTANHRLTLGTIAGALALNAVLRYGLGVEALPPPLFTLFSGALLYAAVFMVTDPVSAPKIAASQWIYGIFIGAMIVFFRYKAVFAGGVAFSILLGNMVAPSLDLWIKRSREYRAAKGAAR